MSHALVIEPLSAEHDRRAFESGTPALDRYIREQAGQDVRRHVTSCYVARRLEEKRVVGYYTTSMSGVPLTDFPPEIATKLPRYPSIPVSRVGRLAVDLNSRGQGFGSTLLTDAIARTHRSEIAAFAVVVDAKDENAVSFYRKMGFTRFASIPMSLFFPIGEFARRTSHPKDRK